MLCFPLLCFTCLPFAIFYLPSFSLFYFHSLCFTFLPFALLDSLFLYFPPFSFIFSHFLYLPPFFFTFLPFSLLSSSLLYFPHFYFTCLPFPLLASLLLYFPPVAFVVTFLVFSLLSSRLLYFPHLCFTWLPCAALAPHCFYFFLFVSFSPSDSFFFRPLYFILLYFVWFVGILLLLSCLHFNFLIPPLCLIFPPHHLVLPSSLYIIPFWSDLHLLWWSFIDYLLHIPLFYCSPAFVSLPLRKCSSLCRSPFSLCIALPASAAVRVLYCVPLPRDVWCGIDLMASSPREWRLRNVYDAASWRHVLGHARGGFNLPRASSSFSSSSRSFVSLVKFFEAKHLFPGH